MSLTEHILSASLSELRALLAFAVARRRIWLVWTAGGWEVLP